jgi:multicomponent Na+:H+ antiporter subunit C
MIETAPAIVLVIAIGAFFISGVYLLLERSLTRVLIGFILLGNGANLLFLVASGRAGRAPIIGEAPESEMSDPLPQAMVLTAIVITLGITAFVLAMAYRSWQLNGHDEVQDDLEDRRIARLAAQNVPVTQDDDVDEVDVPSLDDQAADVRDETDDLSEGLPPGPAATPEEPSSVTRRRGLLPEPSHDSPRPDEEGR